MNDVPPPHRLHPVPRPWRPAEIIALCALIGSLALLGYERVARVRHLWRPAVAVYVPGGVLQACVDRGSIEFEAMRDQGSRRVRLRWKRVSHLGRSGYRSGAHLGGRGFGIAFQPRAVTGSDYVIPAHAALAIPLALIAAAAGIVFLYSRRRGGWLVDRPR